MDVAEFSLPKHSMQPELDDVGPLGLIYLVLGLHEEDGLGADRLSGAGTASPCYGRLPHCRKHLG